MPIKLNHHPAWGNSSRNEPKKVKPNPVSFIDTVKDFPRVSILDQKNYRPTIPYIKNSSIFELKN